MLLILGAGGFARELYFHVQDSLASNNNSEDIFFYDDLSGKDQLNISGKTFPVISNFSQAKGAKFIAAIGDPKTKMKLVSNALAAGLYPADPVIHPSAILQDKNGIHIGKGSVISPNCVITTNVTIGEHVILNLSCTVGHDAIIEDFVTINPGVAISGNVILKKAAFIGTSSAIIEKKVVAEEIILGAQSCVVKNLDQIGATYVGVPATIKSKI